jgi:cytochrome c oxidase assembly protein Cox11
MEFKTMANYVYDVAGIFILWIVIHYAAANFYPMFCAETSVYGFIKSVFVAQAPHCVAMRWLIYNGGNVINSMWTSVALWFSTKIFNSLLTVKKKEE